MALKDLFKNYVYPISTLSGSIIGVGFLSLPYITSKVGIFTMLFYFVVLTILVVFVHLIFGEICLATPDFKRWPGFVGFYFGENAKKIISVSMILGSYGVLLAYLIIGGQFLSSLISPFLGGDPFIYTILYLFILSIIIYFGTKPISRIEFWAILLLLFSLILVFIRGFSQIKLANLFHSLIPSGNFKNLFLPYGALLFSLWGTGLIPETEEMIRGRKKSLKKIIIIATLIPAVVYLIFTLLILGISGQNTTESALVGLKDFLNSGSVSIVLLIGVITTFTAFIAQGLLLKKIFMYDMKIQSLPAWIFTCFPPLILFIIGLNSFIGLISFVGGILLGIDGILILLIYNKLGGKKIIALPMMAVFLLGIIYEIIYFIK